MPNVNAVLNHQIARLAQRVVKSSTSVTRKLVARHRRDLATLKRQVAGLTKRLAFAEKHQPTAIVPPPALLEKARFRAIGVKAHRAKLGLSAENYGKLVGVSGLTVYAWESGKSKPRPPQKAKWLAVRALGKRAARQRLALAQPNMPPAAKPAPRPTARRRQYRQTGQQMILALFKGRTALTTSQINAAWKKADRGWKADKTLGRLVAAKKLRRKPLGGKKGSEYRPA